MDWDLSVCGDSEDEAMQYLFEICREVGKSFVMATLFISIEYHLCLTFIMEQSTHGRDDGDDDGDDDNDDIEEEEYKRVQRSTKNDNWSIAVLVNA